MEKKSVQNNRHIILSGGSKGLGLAISEDLLTHGYSVSTFSRLKTDGVEDLLKRYPEQYYYETLDINDSKALSEFVQNVTKRFPNLYGLINNAAVAQDGILATLPEVEIQKMVNINLVGPLLLTRLFVRKIMQANQGRILNISSIIGSRGYVGLAVYSATKAALDGMTRSLARELGKKNVTVNSIAPGYMQSDLSASLTQEQLEQIQRRTPLERLATPNDIIPLLRFLLGDEASFITGQTILVDGGIST